MRFLSLMLLLTACGGDSFRWYCDELTTTPSTWRFDSGCGELLLRVDQGPHGDCTVEPWTYTHFDQASGFLSHDETPACSTTAHCASRGDLQLVAVGADMKVMNSACYGDGTAVAP